MQIERHVVSITTDGSGVGLGYTPVVSGRVLAISYVKPGAGGYSAGVDFAVTAEASGESIWAEDNVDASTVRYPRRQVHDVAGVGATLDGTRLMRDPIVLGNDRVKIAIANGGATLIGEFHVLIG